ERARITLDRFSEDLHSFYFGEDGMFIGESTIYGDNRADQLSFTSRAHLVLNKKEPVRGLTRIFYRVEEQDDTGLFRLYRADVPVLPGAVPADEEDGFLLCDGLRQVAFTYIDEDGNEYESWSTEEKKQQGEGGLLLPVLVRMNIGFGDDEEEDGLIHYSSAVALPAGRERR
ncbi:MAG TPA: type II secretion system protein GspJ, partial [Desulfopila sp.]|nr:type II secretion system protein GspJ [Desulfopila sp.]